MTNKQRLSGVTITLVAAFSFLSLGSCRNRPGAATKSIETGQEEGHTIDGSIAFRDIFLGSIWDSDLATSGPFYAYLPKPEMMTAPDAQSAEAFFSEVNRRYAQENSTSLFHYGQQIPPNPMKSAEILGHLQEEPITIIVFPGIFGEFIDNVPFDEILSRQDSIFAVEANQKLAAIENQPAGTDISYNLNSDSQTPLPLREVVQSASVDGKGGTILFRVVMLKTPFMSLESLGTIDKSSTILLRRLEKYLTAVGTQKKMVFVGYSRGLPLALDVLAKAKDRPWISAVRGVVSLGGVTYGTESADDAQKSGTVLFKQIQALQELGSKLKETDSLSIAAATSQIAKNTLAWTSFLNTMRTADTNFSLLSFLVSQEGTDPVSAYGTFSKIYASLGLTRPVGNYSANIRKFKVLIQEILSGIDGLTTKTRSAWWSQHIVPVHGITYYSLVGSFADPSEAQDANALATNHYTLRFDSPDDRILHDAQRGLRESSGQALNDSQVPVFRARFWPEVASLMNPNQPPYSSKFLGVVGTHHWALALPIVTKTTDHLINPFPRSELLMAIAAQLAIDIHGEAGN